MKIAFVLSLCLAAATAQARPLKSLCERFEPLRKISDLKYIKHRMRAEPSTPGVKVQDVVFTIEAKAGVIKISPNAEGLVDLPLTEALCAENPNIEVNQPPGTLSLGISIEPAVPPSRNFDYKLLDALRREWAEAVARQNLLLRTLAPNATAFQLEFEPGKAVSAEIRLAKGTRKIAADEKGLLRIPFEDSWIAANPAIVLSEMPRRIGLAFK